MNTITLNKLPEILIKSILLYLDVSNLTNIKINKLFNNESNEVTKFIAEYLLKNQQNKADFIELNDESKEINYLKILFEITESQNEILLMGCSNGIECNEVSKMIIKKDGSINYEEYIPNLHKRFFQSTIYHKGSIFSFGSSSIGSLQRVARRSTEKINKITKEQEFMTNLPNSFHYGCVGILHDKIYAISCTRNVYVLDNIQNIWKKQKEKTNYARHEGFVINFQNKLYLCGGDSSNRSVEVFDPLLGYWCIDSVIKYQKWGNTLLEYKNELYTIGCNLIQGNNYMVIEKRDNKNKKWTCITKLYEDRGGCGIFLAGSKIYLIGGKSNQNTFNFYDIEIDIWASEYQPNTMRKLNRDFLYSNAVNITPNYEKIWTNLSF
jgi:hypothetical protein